MARKTFTLNRKAIKALLRSDEVEAELRRRAERVAAAAGPGHRVDSGKGPSRARAAVITDTTAARRAEAKHRTLTRALNAAKG